MLFSICNVETSNASKKFDRFLRRNGTYVISHNVYNIFSLPTQLFSLFSIERTDTTHPVGLQSVSVIGTFVPQIIVYSNIPKKQTGDVRIEVNTQNLAIILLAQGCDAQMEMKKDRTRRKK